MKAKQPLTVATLALLVARTEAKATPHRIPDFQKILAQGVPEDAPLYGTMFFLEECNTGGPWALERWRFTAYNRHSSPITFWADLLPDLISSQETEEK